MMGEIDQFSIPMSRSQKCFCGEECARPVFQTLCASVLSSLSAALQCNSFVSVNLMNTCIYMKRIKKAKYGKRFYSIYLFSIQGPRVA